MRPDPAEQANFDQPRDLMMLDDAEMALQMSDLAPIAFAPAQKGPVAVAKRVPAPPMQYNDFVTELSAAACLIMDREECETLAKELLERHELIAA